MVEGCGVEVLRVSQGGLYLDLDYLFLDVGQYIYIYPILTRTSGIQFLAVDLEHGLDRHGKFSSFLKDAIIQAPQQKLPHVHLAKYHRPPDPRFMETSAKNAHNVEQALGPYSKV